MFYVQLNLEFIFLVTIARTSSRYKIQKAKKYYQARFSSCSADKQHRKANRVEVLQYVSVCHKCVKSSSVCRIHEQNVRQYGMSVSEKSGRDAAKYAMSQALARK